LVEQPIRNRQVSGSSPLVGSIIYPVVHAGERDFFLFLLVWVGSHLARETNSEARILFPSLQGAIPAS
jgi:hypothetical protein